MSEAAERGYPFADPPKIEGVSWEECNGVWFPSIPRLHGETLDEFTDRRDRIELELDSTCKERQREVDDYVKKQFSRYLRKIAESN